MPKGTVIKALEAPKRRLCDSRNCYLKPKMFGFEQHLLLAQLLEEGSPDDMVEAAVITTEDQQKAHDRSGWVSADGFKNPLPTVFPPPHVRDSELCEIRLVDLDLLTGTLRVTGKGSRYREIPLRPELAE